MEAELQAKQEKLQQLAARGSVRPAALAALEAEVEELRRLVIAIAQLRAAYEAELQLAETVRKIIVEDYQLQGMSSEQEVVEALAARQAELDAAKAQGKSQAVVNRLQTRVEVLQAVRHEIAALKDPMDGPGAMDQEV